VLRTLLTSLLLLVGCSAGLGNAPTATVTRGELKVVLGVPGELEAVRSENISGPNVRGGLKITALAEEGARVKKGDVLVEFDRTDMEKDLEGAESRLLVARTKIAQKVAQQEVSLASAENEVVKAQLDEKRAALRVTDSETVPRVDRETARLDVQESTLSVQRSNAAFQSAKLEAAAELELLQLDEREAQAKVDQIHRQLEQLTILAPNDGIVILAEAWRQGKMGKASVGDSVWPGNPIMELPDLAEMRVKAWVHEVDAAQVEPGQPVNVVVDARPDAPVAGTVDRVSDLAVKRDESSEVKHLEVTVTLATTDPALKPGMTVRAEIGVATVPDVLKIPREAVFYDGAAPYVWRAGLGGWRRTDVKLGRTNDSHVVVTEGLAEGDQVALVDPEALERGEAPGAAGPSPTPAGPAPASAAAAP
jgi:RND family efflux transporter MFP subunit